MDELALMTYRDRLLRAGMPHKRVRRHLCELRDHYYELRREGQSRGLDVADAGTWAQAQLGSLRDMEAAMTQSYARRSLWQRLPRLLPLALPVGLYMLSLLAVLVSMVAYLQTTGAEDGADYFSVARPEWLELVYMSIRIFLLHLLTPLLALLLLRQQVRQQVAPGYALAGILWLCLLGSSTNITLVWPDPAAQIQGMMEASVGYGWRHSNSLRLLLNLVLSYGVGWYWWRRHNTRLIE